MSQRLVDGLLDCLGQAKTKNVRLVVGPDGTKFVFLYQLEEMRMGYEIASFCWGCILDGKPVVSQHPKQLYVFCSVKEVVKWQTDERFQVSIYTKQRDEEGVIALLTVDYGLGMNIESGKRADSGTLVEADFFDYDQEIMIEQAYAKNAEADNRNWWQHWLKR